jgi:hypothetical protein
LTIHLPMLKRTATHRMISAMTLAVTICKEEMQ